MIMKIWQTPVWCGDSEGLLHRINYKRGRVVETRLHSVAKGKHGAVDGMEFWISILIIDWLVLVWTH